MSRDTQGRFLPGHPNPRGFGGRKWPAWPIRVTEDGEERQCSKCGEWWFWPEQFAQPTRNSRECKACRNARQTRDNQRARERDRIALERLRR